MCTLSWQISQGSLQLVFNRDESLDRAIAEPPRIEQGPQGALLSPTDPQGGGTWLSVNDQGLVLCLLNDYRSKPGSPRQSRGLLVKALADCHSLNDLAARLARLSLTDYAPFKLVVFPGPVAPRLWHWTGKTLTEIVAPSSPLSSSSLLPAVTPWLRRRWFRYKTQGNLVQLNQDEHRALHSNNGPLGRHLGIQMCRSQRATVSRCHLELTTDAARLHYHDLHSNNQSTTVLDIKPRTTRQGAWSVKRDRPLNFEALFKSKNPALHQSLPRLIWPLLRWVLCEARLNRRLSKLDDHNASDFCAKVLDHLDVSMRISPDSATLPDAKTRPVFLANHPSGGIDGVVLIAWLSQHYPELKVVVSDALLALPHLEPFVVPVDRYQRNPGALRKLHQTFEGEAAILVFPAGRTARRQQGRLVDAPWQKMPITLARQYQRSLTPVHLETANSRPFYALASLRKALGIRLNLEMLLLVRELLKPAQKTPVVALGPCLTADEWMPQGQTDLERLAFWRGQYEQLAGIAEPPPSNTEAYS